MSPDGKNLAYIVIGGIKFYARKEIKDVLAYLRLVVNPKDDISMQRVINVPPRGIGEKTIALIRAAAARRAANVWVALVELSTSVELGSRARTSIAAFV